MNNVEKFEDFLDRMQGLLDEAKKQGHIIVRVEDLENAFPELKEREDERMRKGIIRNLEYLANRAEGFVKDDLKEKIAWLENQGEQKPAWSEEDENLLFWTIRNLVELKDRFGKRYGKSGKCIDWLKSLKDRVGCETNCTTMWKPSEEQIHWLKWAISRMPDTEKANEAEAVLEDLLEQLKKL